MNDKAKAIQFESESSPGKFYSVDTESLTCTCPFFEKKLTELPLDDPHRLCKHLTQAISKIGVPEVLGTYRTEIDQAAEKKVRFEGRRSVRQDKTVPLGIGAVQTVAVSKKKRFFREWCG